MLLKCSSLEPGKGKGKLTRAATGKNKQFCSSIPCVVPGGESDFRPKITNSNFEPSNMTLGEKHIATTRVTTTTSTPNSDTTSGDVSSSRVDVELTRVKSSIYLYLPVYYNSSPFGELHRLAFARIFSSFRIGQLSNGDWTLILLDRVDTTKCSAQSNYVTHSSCFNSIQDDSKCFIYILFCFLAFRRVLVVDSNSTRFDSAGVCYRHGSDGFLCVARKKKLVFFTSIIGGLHRNSCFDTRSLSFSLSISLHLLSFLSFSLTRSLPFTSLYLRQSYFLRGGHSNIFIPY